MILQTRRWLPDRELVVVADSAFSALEWQHALVRQNITVITRLRLDAALYQPAPFRHPDTNGQGQLLKKTKYSMIALRVFEYSLRSGVGYPRETLRIIGSYLGV
jgi:hypothetical protein